MRKFLISLLLLALVLSACAQEETLAKEGTLCGTLTAFKREGIELQAENDAAYCFELPLGLDLSAFAVGDKVCVDYRVEENPVAYHVAAVELEWGELVVVRPASFTISLGGGAAMTFAYGEHIDMDAFEQGDRLCVEYYVDNIHTEALSVSRAQDE